MNESIGARLREAREKRQLSLQQASDTTKVRTHYLQALENDDLSAMPSVAQARGFLRIYAEFLGLQGADLVPPAPPTPAATPSAELPAYVEPKTAPKAETTAPTKAPPPNLLDNVRGLVSRRGKPDEAMLSEPAGATDARDIGSVVRDGSDDALNPAKKKASR